MSEINREGMKIIGLFSVLTLGTLYLDFLFGVLVCAGMLLYVCVSPEFRIENDTN